MVGAVIVKNGKIIGKGYHKVFGGAHAENEAICSVAENPEGATIYVNLEPCSHFGKTPPCTGAIIKAGITRVVCCTRDPNPIVKGKSIKKMEEAGISVTVGELEKESRELNEIFFTFHEKKRPFIALKFAESLDGKIATKTHDSKWITNEKARTFARILRSQYQSILVGINTVLNDDPNLGIRIKGKKDPMRIILDSALRIPLNRQVLRDNRIIIATTGNADKEKKKLLRNRGVEILSFKGDQIPLVELLRELANKEITSIFVEGGSHVLGNFVDTGLIDKIYVFHAPLLIGGEQAVSAIGGTGAKTVKDALRLHNVSYRKFDDNMLTIGYTE